MPETLIFENELSYLIMQAGYEVHNAFGPGFPESIYEEAVRRELMRRRVKVEWQERVVVQFKGRPIGEFVLDCVVNEMIIFEISGQ
jgi:GxxExxY protein